MLAGEFFIIILQYRYGIVHRLGTTHPPELDQQALTQVPGAHACRLEVLDDGYHPLDLVDVGSNVGVECKVIDKGQGISPEIAVLVKHTDNECGDFLFLLAEVTESELLEQALGKTLANGKSIVFGTGILAPVVDLELVAGNVFVLGKLVYRNISGIVLVALPVGIRTVVKHWVLLNLGTDPLLELLDWEFNQLDGLYLQGRKFLLLLEFKVLSHTVQCYRVRSSSPPSGYTP